MRKGVSYLIVAIIIALGIVVLYYWGGGPTGYTILSEYENQTVCEDAGYIWEEIIEQNCTEIPDCVVCVEGCVTEYTEVLCEEGCQENCTEIPDCVVCVEGCVTEYTEVLCEESCQETCEECEDIVVGGQCIANECGADFLELCLDETNCTEAGGYWYNDLCNEEQQLLSVEITEPSGTLDFDSEIPIEYTITGAENVSISCWYNLRYASDDTIAKTNTTLVDCENSIFDVPDEESYILTLYVESSEELVYDESSFSVSLPTETEETSEEEEEEEAGEEESSVQVPSVPSFELIAEDISDISLASGDSQGIIWSVSSEGLSPISGCSVKPLGDYASWITSEGTLDINAGEVGVFAFDILVPEGTAEGSYSLGVSVECEETAVSKYFNIEVSAISEEAGEGAPVGGFVIFGEGGIGVGGIIILVFVVLALGAVLFFARRMRQSGKTLKDIFNNIKFKFRRQ